MPLYPVDYVEASIRSHGEYEVTRQIFYLKRRIFSNIFSSRAIPPSGAATVTIAAKWQLPQSKSTWSIVSVAKLTIPCTEGYYLSNRVIGSSDESKDDTRRKQPPDDGGDDHDRGG